MPARLEDWGGEPPLRARVRHVEPLAFRKVSALGVEEQRTRVLFDFVEAPVALGDGYRVMVRVEIARAAAAVTVPASALFRCSSAWCVFAIEGGRARRREIRPGLRNADLAAVESGLAVGQQVVRFPDLALQDGSRVSIRGGGTGPGG
jgi:HlyD family secretion protein